MAPIPDSIIVIRLPRPHKGRYVAASRAAGLTLEAWIRQTLDAHAPPFPAHEPAPETKPQP